MSFEQFSLDPRILAGVKAMGYTTPTPIQQQAIPVVLKGHDMLGIAQTGTGKTGAFILPILQRLLKGNRRQRAGIDRGSHPRTRRTDPRCQHRTGQAHQSAQRYRSTAV